MKEFAMYLGTICFVVSIVCFVLAYKKKKKKEKINKLLMVKVVPVRRTAP